MTRVRHGWLIAAIALAAAPLRAAEDPVEVVVTAAKRAEARLDVPASIARLDAPELRLLGAQHASEALNRVAGVMVQRGSGQESLTAIRSPVLAGPGACGAFLLLEDGMPLRPVGSCNVNEVFESDTGLARAIASPAGHGSHGIL